MTMASYRRRGDGPGISAEHAATAGQSWDGPLITTDKKVVPVPCDDAGPPST